MLGAQDDDDESDETVSHNSAKDKFASCSSARGNASENDAVLDCVANKDGSDILYFAKMGVAQAPASAGRQMFLLRSPNTGGVDLFSQDIADQAEKAIGGC